jgi:hypothetical protein
MRKSFQAKPVGPDFEYRRQRCKHIYAVEITLSRKIVTDGHTQTVTETVTVKKSYSQSWPEYNKAQQYEKTHFMEFLHQLCSGIEEPIQTNGRPRLPLKDMIFAATYKTYTGISARRFTSDLRDALAKGYISKMPSQLCLWLLSNGICHAVLETVDRAERIAPQVNRDRIRG